MSDFPIPQAILFGQWLTAGVRRSWMQLACLADEAGRTPPMELDELVRATGKSRATLYRHLGRLKQAGLLDWTRVGGVIQVSLEAVGDERAEEAQGCATQDCSAQECVAQGCARSETGPEDGEAQCSILSDSQYCESQNCESQICECASLKYLINPLINLTREEARFSKSRILSKTRKQPLFSQKCANDRPKRGPPGVNCRCLGSQAASNAAATAGDEAGWLGGRRGGKLRY